MRRLAFALLLLGCSGPPEDKGPLCCIQAGDSCTCFTEADYNAVNVCSTLEDPHWRYISSCPPCSEGKIPCR